MAGFQVMGGVPEGYAGILSGAGANLVRMPDGSYRPAPQMSGPTSLDQIYAGILSGQSPNDPVGPGTDWGALTGMLDDPSYSGIPDPSTYGQPPQTVAQTRAEQPRPSPALTAIADLAGIPQASGTMSTDKDQTRLNTTMLAFNGDQATGIPANGMGGGGMGASGGASLLPKGFPGGSMAGIGGRSFLPANPGQTDWSVANNGMQGINGPNDAKYLANDPRNKLAGKSALPKKYATNIAPGTFNRETGTWNTGTPASGSALPSFGGGAGNMLSLLFGMTPIRRGLAALQKLTAGPPQTPLQAGSGVAGGALPNNSMPLLNLNTVSPDSPAAGLLAKNGGGLGAGAQVSFKSPASQQRWLTGY